MTRYFFEQWLHHSAKYKVAGNPLLISDGASFHLDANTVRAAELHGITLYEV
jgi:hypothetical protein